MAAAQGSFHLLVEVEGVDGHDRQKKEDEQRQLCVDGNQDGKSADKVEQRDHNVFWPMMKQLGQIERIVGEAGHELPHFLLIIKGKGQLLVMIKQLAPHVVFHFGAHHVPLVGHKHVGQRMNEDQSQHHRAHAPNLVYGVRTIADQYIFGDEIGAQRDEQCRNRHHQSAGHIGPKQALVRFVVRQKLPGPVVE